MFGLLCLLAPAAPSTTTYVLHKFMQPIGEETDTVLVSENRRETSAKFKFVDRGSPVVLEGALTTDARFRPLSLSVKGQVARTTPIDLTLTVQDGKAIILRGKDQATETVPVGGVAVAGYAPVAFQQNLVQSWIASGRPAKVVTVPHGEVTIRETARDRFVVDGKPVSLHRLAVRGLVWGLETVWSDDEGHLAAVICRDAEFDHFEAVRTDLKDQVSRFARLAAEDAMRELARISKGTQIPTRKLVALTGGRVFDGYRVIENGTVLLDGPKIAAVGPKGEVAVPAGAEVISVAGKTVLPGLWDMHAHFEQAEWGPTYLAAGVTTVRDCGNVFEFITSVRDAIDKGQGIGPRLLLAGLVDGDGRTALGVNRVNNAEQAKAMVKRYHDAGFLQIKIYSSMKKENVRAVADEAHRLGMTVTGHIPNGMTLQDGLDAGMDQVNHIQYLCEDILGPNPMGRLNTIDLSSLEVQAKLSALKAHGTVLDPTVALFEILLHPATTPASSFEPGLAKVPPELKPALDGMAEGQPIPMYGKVLDLFIRIVGAAHRAGIPIVAGTDQAIPGHSLHRELELYVQAGMTPTEAIQSATVVPARAMGLGRTTGALKAGYRADVLVVDGNPLIDIKATRKVRDVFANGKRYAPARLWQLVGFTP